MDFTNTETSESCNSATRAYELGFDKDVGRIVCDNTSDQCGRSICQCDER